MVAPRRQDSGDDRMRAVGGGTIHSLRGLVGSRALQQPEREGTHGRQGEGVRLSPLW